MITLFQVNGSLMYVDPQGNATGYDDVFTRCQPRQTEGGPTR